MSRDTTELLGQTVLNLLTREWGVITKITFDAVPTNPVLFHIQDKVTPQRSPTEALRRDFMTRKDIELLDYPPPPSSISMLVENLKEENRGLHTKLEMERGVAADRGAKLKTAESKLAEERKISDGRLAGNQELLGRLQRADAEVVRLATLTTQRDDTIRALLNERDELKRNLAEADRAYTSKVEALTKEHLKTLELQESNFNTDRRVLTGNVKHVMMQRDARDVDIESHRETIKTLKGRLEERDRTLAKLEADMAKVFERFNESILSLGTTMAVNLRRALEEGGRVVRVGISRSYVDMEYLDSLIIQELVKKDPKGDGK